MDKFGIFKLLGSFMDYYAKNKSPSSVNGEKSANPETKGLNALGDVLTSLFKKNKNAADARFTAKDTPAPLKNSMLDAIKRHDAIVNRIKRK